MCGNAYGFGLPGCLLLHDGASQCSATRLYHRGPSWLLACKPAVIASSVRLTLSLPGMAVRAHLCAGFLRSRRSPSSTQRRACDCSCVVPVHRAGHGQECLSCCRSAPGGCPEAQGVTGRALLAEHLCHAGLLPILRRHAVYSIAFPMTC